MSYKIELEIRSTYKELDKLEGFLNSLQENLKFDDEFYAKLMLTVSEAATNGVVHGNELNPDKKVFLKAESKNRGLVISIQDEGDGFDPENIPDPLAEENLLNTSGRGVFLMEEYAKSVEYQDKGRRLILSFDLPT